MLTIIYSSGEGFSCRRHLRAKATSVTAHAAPSSGMSRFIVFCSCVRARASSSVFGRDAYPGLDDKAAVLLESLVGNHALVDGNKRLGWLSLVVFFGLNGIDLDAPDDEAYDLVIAVASGTATYQEVSARLASWH